MRFDALRNLLTALGALFVILLLLSFILVFSTSGIDFSDKVAVVKIEGLITDPTHINRQIKELAERDDVKAVVLRIDSPGGGVGPSQEIYREVRRLRDSKKVVASMGAVAASGGYYIAVAAHKIVANPGTITGSIGVIAEFVNMEELFSKIGLKGYVIKTGRFKDTGSPFRDMDKEERNLIQGVLDDVHDQFIDAVAEGRNMEREEVVRLADGRIFSGRQAKAKGLVDYIGNLSDAIELGAELAGIEGKPHVIYPERETMGLWREIVDSAVQGIVRGLYSGVRFMYLLQRPVS